MPFRRSTTFSTASSSSRSRIDGVSLVPCEQLVASVYTRLFVSVRNGNSGTITARSAAGLEHPFSAGVLPEDLGTNIKSWPVMDRSPCSARSATPAIANGMNLRRDCVHQSVADMVRIGWDSTCDDTNDVRHSVTENTGSDCSKGERPRSPSAFQGSNSRIFFLRGSLRSAEKHRS